MTSESEGGEERRWLLRPPEPGQFGLLFQVGEGAELTPEVNAALNRLVTALGSSEVEGYSQAIDFCLGLRYCVSYGPYCPSDWPCHLCSRLNSCNLSA